MENISLGIFNKYFLYLKTFNNIFGVDLTLTPFSKFPVKFKISLYNNNYEDSNYKELNSINYILALETIFDKQSHYFGFVFEIERNKTESIYYSWYLLISSFKYFKKEILNLLDIKFDINYEIKIYDYERKDNIINLNFSIPINIYKNFQLIPRYIYIINNSNISYFYYERHNFLISLNLNVF